MGRSIVRSFVTAEASARRDVSPCCSNQSGSSSVRSSYASSSLASSTPAGSSMSRCQSSDTSASGGCGAPPVSQPPRSRSISSGRSSSSSKPCSWAWCSRPARDDHTGTSRPTCRSRSASSSTTQPACHRCSLSTSSTSNSSGIEPLSEYGETPRVAGEDQAAHQVDPPVAAVEAAGPCLLVGCRQNGGRCRRAGKQPREQLDPEAAALERRADVQLAHLEGAVEPVLDVR